MSFPSVMIVSAMVTHLTVPIPMDYNSAKI